MLSLLEKRPWLRHLDYTFPWTINYPRIPAYQILRDTANAHPNRACTSFYGTEITFWEMYLSVTRFANALTELGVQKGDRVGIFLPNCPQFVLSFCAILNIGGIVVNLNPQYTYPELKHCADITGMKGIITFDLLIPMVKPLAQACNIPLVMVTKLTDFVNGAGVSTKESLGLEEGWYHYSELLDNCTNKIPPRPDLKPEDPALLELIERAKDLNVYLSEGWGMSETTSLGISNPVMGIKKPMSIGVPYPDNDVRLVDPDTLEDVPQGERGEIWIKGPTVMIGYWNNPEETLNQLQDGWLRTGDVAYQDEDGYVFIVDRTKDMIIAGGFNIYPRDIDEVLFAHPKVKDVITVGIPDEYRGETIKAFVQLVEGQTATEEELRNYCREYLSAYKVPKMIEFRKELPRTVVGKALRRLLRDEEINKSK